MRIDIVNRKDEILKWISEEQSKAYICKQLECKSSTLESYLRKFGVVYAGNQGSRGKKHGMRYVPALEYIKGKHVSAHKLRLKLLKEGIKQHQCEICKMTEWMNKPIPLELDHIDGNHFNNDLNNIRIICPNCHAQTDTNSGKNVKRKMPL